MFRKRPSPAVGEIEDRHVEHEHGVMSVRASSKKGAHSAPEIVFTLFGFHFDFRTSPTLTGPAACYHQAVVGFASASFEGEKKSGVSSARSLNFQGLNRLT